jgi:hypothetical protein
MSRINETDRKTFEQYLDLVGQFLLDNATMYQAPLETFRDELGGQPFRVVIFGTEADDRTDLACQLDPHGFHLLNEEPDESARRWFRGPVSPSRCSGPPTPLRRASR